MTKEKSFITVTPGGLIEDPTALLDGARTPPTVFRKMLNLNYDFGEAMIW